MSNEIMKYFGVKIVIVQKDPLNNRLVRGEVDDDADEELRMPILAALMSEKKKDYCSSGTAQYIAETD